MLNPEISNSIATIKKYLNDPSNVYAVFRAGALTSDLETPMVNFIGARSISYPVFPLSTDDMENYNPAQGYSRTNAVLERREKTVSQDKGYQMAIDNLDLADSGTTAVAYINNNVRQKDVPTVDKYRLKKLYEGGKKTQFEKATSETALTQYDAAKAYLIDHEVPADGTIMYCTTDYYNSVKDSTRIMRTADANAGANIDRNVEYLDKQTKIVVVPSTRLPNSSVQFILVNPKCVICGVKRNVSRVVEEPEDFDGVLINRRLVHECLIQEDRVDGVFVNTTETITA